MNDKCDTTKRWSRGRVNWCLRHRRARALYALAALAIVFIESGNFLPTLAGALFSAAVFPFDD